jgi:hypothetical protein
LELFAILRDEIEGSMLALPVRDEGKQRLGWLAEFNATELPERKDPKRSLAPGASLRQHARP